MLALNFWGGWRFLWRSSGVQSDFGKLKRSSFSTWAVSGFPPRGIISPRRYVYVALLKGVGEIRREIEDVTSAGEKPWNAAPLDFGHCHSATAFTPATRCG